MTEQVAEHTNGTIGALLNATFGNAPELLIAAAALRKGFYRVVQLAMLGSMLTNLLFVFGISCLIGGFRWQVQELRITSGNVSVGMLLLSTAGSLLPATLVLGGQLKHNSDDGTPSGETLEGDEIPSVEELQFCRINAFIMIMMYGCYLIFQLGTHKEEFDEDDNVVEHLSPHFTARHGGQQNARRNVFCMWLVRRTKCFLKMDNENDFDVAEDGWMPSPTIRAENNAVGGGGGDVEMMFRDNHRLLSLIPSEHERPDHESGSESSSDDVCLLPQNNASLHQDDGENYFEEYANDTSGAVNKRSSKSAPVNESSRQEPSGKGNKKKKTNGQRPMLPLGLAEPPGVHRGP